MLLSSNPTKVLSPAALNNRGVLLLNAGRVVDAARCYAKASKTLVSILSRQCKEPYHEQQNTGQQQSNATTTTPNRKRKGEAQSNIITSTPVGLLHPRLASMVSNNLLERINSIHKISPGNQEDLLESEPKGNIAFTALRAVVEDPSTDPTYHNHHLHGRPLWIQRSNNRNNTASLVDITATILYNLGLSFHLSAVAKHKKTQYVNNTNTRPVYQRALAYYKMAHETIEYGSRFKFYQSPILAVTLHNMIQIQVVLGEMQSAHHYQDQLAQMLCLMGTSLQGIFKKNHYEQFLMKLLLFRKSTAIALAA